MRRSRSRLGLLRGPSGDLRGTEFCKEKEYLPIFETSLGRSGIEDEGTDSMLILYHVQDAGNVPRRGST